MGAVIGVLNGGDGQVCVSVTWLIVVALILVIAYLALRILGKR